MSANPLLGDVRTYVHDEVKPLVPAAWDIKRGIVTPGTLSKTTVFLEYTSIAPLPAAPIGNALCTLNLTVASPLTDESKAEVAVDDNVVDLVLALDGHSRIVWTGAEKKVIEDTYIAWTVSLNVYARTAKPTPPAPEE